MLTLLSLKFCFGCSTVNQAALLFPTSSLLNSIQGKKNKSWETTKRYTSAI